jgi:hypothetical protein
VSRWDFKHDLPPRFDHSLAIADWTDAQPLVHSVAQIQPGVFFTFEAPFVRIVALYVNTLEDPGVIANEDIGNSQLDFIEAALKRIEQDKYQGALLFATHHPPYTAGSTHGWSVDMLSQIDEICERVGIWPHAFLSGLLITISALPGLDRMALKSRI